MNKNTRENIILTAKNILSIIIITICWFLIVWFAKQKEPIQELVNQIQLNQEKIQQYEERTNELYALNEQHKETLLNKYWLELSKAFTKNVEADKSEWCNQALKTSLKLINDWITSAQYQRDIMKEEWCDEIYEQKLKELSDEWKPWKLSEDWTHQEMPVLTGSDSHERFKQLSSAYWLNASTIWSVENHYWIKEWVILCITIAETSWWNRWYGAKNIWSVWSNDRWDRPVYALMEAWLEDIWKTLNNRYLWSKKTVWCLSNAWSCVEPDDNWKRYATSQSSRENNMKVCLEDIYWDINPSDFIIRR